MSVNNLSQTLREHNTKCINGSEDYVNGRTKGSMCGIAMITTVALAIILSLALGCTGHGALSLDLGLGFGGAAAISTLLMTYYFNKVEEKEDEWVKDVYTILSRGDISEDKAEPILQASLNGFFKAGTDKDESYFKLLLLDKLEKHSNHHKSDQSEKITRTIGGIRKQLPPSTRYNLTP